MPKGDAHVPQLSIHFAMRTRAHSELSNVAVWVMVFFSASAGKMERGTLESCLGVTQVLWVSPDNPQRHSRQCLSRSALGGGRLHRLLGMAPRCISSLCQLEKAPGRT